MGEGSFFRFKLRYQTCIRYNESGENHTESPGKEVEVVWACDEKKGTLRRKEGDGNESTKCLFVRLM